MPFVVDSSVALCWMLPEQESDDSVRLLRSAEENGVVVPALWFLEVANQLGMKRRIGRITERTVREATFLIERLKLIVIPVDDVFPAGLLGFMDSYQLTAYDAVYLQLAQRMQLPVATFDKALIAAAPLAGVVLL